MEFEESVSPLQKPFVRRRGGRVAKTQHSHGLRSTNVKSEREEYAKNIYKELQEDLKKLE